MFLHLASAKMEGSALKRIFLFVTLVIWITKCNNVLMEQFLQEKIPLGHRKLSLCLDIHQSSMKKIMGPLLFVNRECLNMFEILVMTRVPKELF